MNPKTKMINSENEIVNFNSIQQMKYIQSLEDKIRIKIIKHLAL